MLLNAVTRREARAGTGGFRAWRRSRPLVGGVLIALGGVEMFFSGQLDVGRIHIQMGIEGFQATVIPLALVLLGILVIAMPVHRIFYGVIALAVAVYSLVGVNLGGFFLGMLLSSVGGVLAVSWAPRVVAAEGAAVPAARSAETSADTAEVSAATVPADPAEAVAGPADPASPDVWTAISEVSAERPSDGPRSGASR